MRIHGLLILGLAFLLAVQPATAFTDDFPEDFTEIVMFLETLFPQLSLTIRDLVVTGVLTAEETHFTNTTVTDINVTKNMTIAGNITVGENADIGGDTILRGELTGITSHFISSSSPQLVLDYTYGIGTDFTIGPFGDLNLKIDGGDMNLGSANFNLTGNIDVGGEGSGKIFAYDGSTTSVGICTGSGYGIQAFDGTDTVDMFVSNVAGIDIDMSGSDSDSIRAGGSNEFIVDAVGNLISGRNITTNETVFAPTINVSKINPQADGDVTLFEDGPVGGIYNHGRKLTIHREEATEGKSNISIYTHGTETGTIEASHSLRLNAGTDATGYIYMNADGNDLGYWRAAGFGFYDDLDFEFGSAVAYSSIIRMSTAQTNNAMLIGLDEDANTVILAEKGDKAYDFSHPEQSYPTMFIQSKNQVTDEWGSLSHDGLYFVINSSKGVKINPNATGDVYLFSESDVYDTGDGKSLFIYRKAAEGDTFFQMYVDQYRQGRINVNNYFKFDSSNTMEFETTGGDVVFDPHLDAQFFLADGAGARQFEVVNSTVDIVASIDSAGNVDFIGNFTGNQIYGEMWYHNHTATPLNFAVDGAYYNLTFDQSTTNGFLFDDADDSLKAQVAGIYRVNYLASGSGQNNHIYHTTVTINDVEQNQTESHKKMTAGGDIVTMTGSGFIRLSADDLIRLATADVGGTGIGNYYSANINLVRIGD